MGLGLRPEHVTQRALDVLRKCTHVLVDAYTTPVPGGFYERLEGMFSFERAERNDLEEGARRIVELARETDVAIAVWGDPFVATTHVMIRNMADEAGVPWSYVPGITAISVVPSILGLQHYRFGRIITIPARWREFPSFIERYRVNRQAGVHTLFLVDPGMDIREALEALAEGGIDEAGVVARATWDDQKVGTGRIAELMEVDWGEPPYSIVVPASMHPEEKEAWERWRVSKRR